MKKMAAGALLIWAAGLYGLSAQATMTFWGLKVYRASLWVTPGFVGAAYDQSAFALELAYLRDLFPDVKSGDSITGVNQPGKGALFLSNGRVLGEISDPEFARLFFGIWLAPQTSEPQLRRNLLARARAIPSNGGTP